MVALSDGHNKCGSFSQESSASVIRVEVQFLLGTAAGVMALAPLLHANWRGSKEGSKQGRRRMKEWKVDVADCQPSTQIRYQLVISRTAFVALPNIQHRHTMGVVTRGMGHYWAGYWS